jgi:hypothetical protein
MHRMNRTAGTLYQYMKAMNRTAGALYQYMKAMISFSAFCRVFVEFWE